MGLDAVVEEIREKMRKEVEAIDRETQEEVNRILTAAQAQAEEIKLQTEEEVRRETNLIIENEKASARMAVNRKILNARKEMLDRLRGAALEAVRNLPRSFHDRALRRLLKQAAKEIPTGRVYCSPEDQQLVEKILGGLKRLSGLSFAGTADIIGGVLVESEDGMIQIGYQYETLLDEIWESEVKEASGILFE
ncbi:MAG: V-type ATP synthase subunit E family protein [Methanoculleaceae archaeon]